MRRRLQFELLRAQLLLPRPRPTRLILFLLSAGVVLLSGCGGESADQEESSPTAAPTTSAPASTAPPTTTATTKEDYLTAANAICRDIVAESAAVPEPASPSEYATAMRRTIDLIKAGQERLRAVPQPPADAAALEAEFLARNDRQIQILEAAMPELEAAAASGDEQRIEAAFGPALESYAAIAVEQERFLRSYGLLGCIEEES